MRDNYIRLYKNHKNKIGYWEGWTENNLVVMQHATGLYDCPQVHEELVKEGKQGRSIQEQAAFRLKSRIKSKLDAGYVESYELAKVRPTDAQGKIKPMLAQKFKDYKDPISPEKAFVQLKYDGYRCLITKRNGELIAYSRNGLELPGVTPILDGIDIPDDVVLDGEVYIHGVKLQTLGSYAKKYQSGSHSLKYMLFDIVAQEPFSRRLDTMYEMASDNILGNRTQVVPTKRLDELSNLAESLKKSKQAGYEGLILRLDDYPYEDARRSKSLLKMKQFMDDEYQVVDILPSKDGWAVLVCKLNAGGTFKVSAPGSMYEKELVYKNKELYLGRWVTVEYAEITNDGKPFQPIATRWRNVVEE